MTNLFFPILNRRNAYSIKANSSFYHYSHYYDEIDEDCLSRCVYCDSHKNELGGDNLQLDHFKPQDSFPLLKNDPSNLVLACPKCNRLKSDYWPIDKEYYFIDPFNENRLDYFMIENSGLISFKHISGKYIINLLQLNRISRQNLRRKRIIHNEALELTKKISDKLQILYIQIEKQDIAREEILHQLSILIELGNDTRMLIEALNI